MSAVVLDGEPLSLLARPRPGRDLDAVRAVLQVAVRRGWPIRVPTTILAELYQGSHADAAVDSALSRFGIRPFTTGQRVARHTGRLMHERGLDSCHLADATVVATALRLGGGIVVTGDQDDLANLASDARTIAVRGIKG